MWHCPSGATVHTLQHTFATRMVRKGTNLGVIQEAWGDRQIATSQRYVHWARGLADSAADGLPMEIG
jgi:site-specific recombinase XerD